MWRRRGAGKSAPRRRCGYSLRCGWAASIVGPDCCTAAHGAACVISQQHEAAITRRDVTATHQHTHRALTPDRHQFKTRCLLARCRRLLVLAGDGEPLLLVPVSLWLAAPTRARAANQFRHLLAPSAAHALFSTPICAKCSQRLTPKIS